MDLNVYVSFKILEEAIEHVNYYTTHHSEAIITDEPMRATVFMNLVDCSTVYHNASTRFTDGFEFGFMQKLVLVHKKLHARGPMGLQALTSYKYFCIWRRPSADVKNICPLFIRAYREAGHEKRRNLVCSLKSR